MGPTAVAVVPKMLSKRAVRIAKLTYGLLIEMLGDTPIERMTLKIPLVMGNNDQEVCESGCNWM